MIPVVPHSKSPFDQRGDALRGPQLCAVPMRHGSPRQPTNQASPLCRRQPTGSPRRRLGLQRRRTAAAPRITPTQNATGVTPKAPADLVQRKLLPEQRYHTATSLLQRRWRTTRSHGGTSFQDTLHVIALLMRMSIAGGTKRTQVADIQTAQRLARKL
jgi:hypothetical protein